MAYIEFDHVVKEYPSGSSVIRALDEASFTAEQGELSVILGQSGAGKTTALNILGGMDTATSGHVMVDGSDITTYGKKQLTQYRRTDIGFVFQFYNVFLSKRVQNAVNRNSICAGNGSDLLICQRDGATVNICVGMKEIGNSLFGICEMRAADIV